eukprot:TRINITY_DN20735_c0_g1_i1.p1 TRINITY_DN20735_c0_g1~~TRINITY_DN20735_c0_g1_i1.p1  ORF type:complete len:135 (+),score=25.90 TRINITY_DN20735_c0_g1_i1:37-441(+)
MSGITQCTDFLAFQKALKQLKDIDDKIIYALNLSTPTESIKARGVNPQENCKNLQEQLEKNYSEREEKIKNCLVVWGDEVKRHKTALDSGDINAASQLKKSQYSLRILKNELNVEEIIRDRSRVVFNEKCREFL